MIEKTKTIIPWYSEACQVQAPKATFQWQPHRLTEAQYRIDTASVGGAFIGSAIGRKIGGPLGALIGFLIGAWGGAQIQGMIEDFEADSLPA